MDNNEDEWIDFHERIPEPYTGMKHFWIRTSEGSMTRHIMEQPMAVPYNRWERGDTWGDWVKITHWKPITIDEVKAYNEMRAQERKNG